MGQTSGCGNCVVRPQISLEKQNRYTTVKAPTKPATETQNSDSDGYDTDSSESSSSSSSASSTSSSSSYTSSSSSTNSTDSTDDCEYVSTHPTDAPHGAIHATKPSEPAPIALPSNPQSFIGSLRINVHSSPASNVKKHTVYHASNTPQYKEPYTPESIAHSETLSVLSPAIASPITHHYRNDSLDIYQKRQHVISPEFVYDNKRLAYPAHAAHTQVKPRSMSEHNLQRLIQLKPLDNVSNLVNSNSLHGNYSSSMSNINTHHRRKMEYRKSKTSRVLTKETSDEWSIDKIDSEQDAMEKELLFLKAFENHDADSEQQAMEKELEYLKEFANHISISPMATDYV